MVVNILPSYAFIYMMIFMRIGTMVMIIPAFGDNSVPGRLRLVFALALSLMMFPVLKGLYSAVPDTLPAIINLFAMEMLIGGILGLLCRLVMSALQVAGTVIAFQTGLAFAQNVDPTQGIQSALMGSFLSVLATAMIFAMDLHHLLFAALYDSYKMFKPGNPIPFAIFGEMALDTIANSFRVGVQIAAPFIVFGLIFNMGIGVLSRLMPQVQIFFVAMPANILLGFILYMLLITAMIMWFTDHFSQSINGLIQ